MGSRLVKRWGCRGLLAQSKRHMLDANNGACYSGHQRALAYFLYRKLSMRRLRNLTFLIVVLSFMPAYQALAGDLLRFCHTAQYWVPVLLHSGGVSGEEVCNVSGGTSCFGSSLGEGICRAGSGSSCFGSTLGEGLCRGGGGAGCLGSSFGEGLCRGGGGTTCLGSNAGEGACRAGGGSGCLGSTFGEGICRAAGGLNCLGKELGEAICASSGRSYCLGKSVSEAICETTGNCKGLDAVSLVNSVVTVCGTKVLHMGLGRFQG